MNLSDFSEQKKTDKVSSLIGTFLFDLSLVLPYPRCELWSCYQARLYSDPFVYVETYRIQCEILP